LIRHGIKRDGTSALAMPADAYSNLADEDLADILAWVRSLPVLPDAADLPQTSWGPIGRVSVLMGGAPFSADMARTSDPPVRRPNGDKEGEYLTKVTCLHCHRLDEEHEVKPGLKSPPVRPVVQGYELSQFLALMRTGKGVGDRELELMSTVARNDLSRMTEAELTAIYTYLTAQEPAGSGEAQPKQETQ
jgi:mono/diheme cytochrome c family protein